MHWVAIVVVLVLLVVVGRAIEARRARSERARRQAVADACAEVARRLGLDGASRQAEAVTLRGAVDGQLVRLVFAAPEGPGPAFARVEVEPGLPPSDALEAAEALSPPLSWRRDRIVAEWSHRGEDTGADRLEALARGALEAGRNLRARAL